MRSLRFVLRNFRPVLLLTAQESLAFLVLAGGLFVILAAARGDSYFAWRWDPAFFPHWLNDPGAAAAAVPFALLVAAAFLLTRLLLLGGTFGVLACGWSGMEAFRRDAHRALGRFLLLAFLFAVPSALLLAGNAAILSALGERSADVRWPLWSALLWGAMVYPSTAPVAFLHAAARFRTLEAGRLRLSFRLRPRALLSFYGYSLPDLPLSAAMGWMVLGLLGGTTGWGALPWLFGFQAAALARNAFRLAAFRCALPDGPGATPAGPRHHPEAEADPPSLLVEATDPDMAP